MIGGAGGQWSYPTQVSSLFVTDGEWHHLALTINGTVENGVNLYVDGNPYPVFTATSDQAINASLVPLRFGAGWPGTDFYNGLMDEVGLWETVLSVPAICALYRLGVVNGPPPDFVENPVAFWRMGDGGQPLQADLLCSSTMRTPCSTFVSPGVKGGTLWTDRQSKGIFVCSPW